MPLTITKIWHNSVCGCVTNIRRLAMTSTSLASRWASDFRAFSPVRLRLRRRQSLCISGATAFVSHPMTGPYARLALPYAPSVTKCVNMRSICSSEASQIHCTSPYPMTTCFDSHPIACTVK